jgi:choline dehydrogenase
MPTTDYDLIVIGAGAGGAVVAARASEDPSVRVLLLEAGPDYPNLEALPEDLRNANHGSFFDHDWKLRYTPSAQSRPDQPFPRGRVVGGSSAVNTAIALRGMPNDYDEWASLGCPNWSWEKVLPYFIRLETDLDFGDQPIHGDSGPLPIRRHPREELVPYQAAFLDACAELGYPARADHNDHTTTGAGAHPMNKRGTLRISTAVAYLAAARGRPNLTIRGDTAVRRIICEDGAATAVEARTNGGNDTITARQIVLAGGAIHTPAILVRSGIGPRDVLDRLGIAVTCERTGVGQHLQDHPAIGPTLTPKPGVADWDQPVIQTTLYYSAKGFDDPNDVQIEPLSFMHIPGQGELRMGLAACIFKSYSFGRLEFDSADIDERPRIVMDYLSDERDYVKILEGMTRAMEICGTKAIARVAEHVRRPTDAELADPAVLESFIRRHCATGAHPSCTARMGPADDEFAVCDNRGFVHGIRNLRIADASMMPRVPSANTNVPTIMIGERIGEWARQDLAK